MAASSLSEKSGAIRTRRLLLRAAQESDLDAFHQLFSNEDVMRYWSCPPHTDISETSKYLDDMISSPTNGTLDFVIVLPSSSSPPSSSSSSSSNDTSASTSDLLIGKAGIWSASQSEIGFMLLPQYWHQGLMTETLLALVGTTTTQPPSSSSSPSFGKIEPPPIVGALWDRNAHMERVVADVDPRNEASRALLAKVGFVEVGIRERTMETHLGWCDSVDLVLRRGGGRE